MGAKNYDVNSYLDGDPSVTLAVFQLPGSNALKTAEDIKAKMQELKAKFPQGMDYKIVYDTTVFIEESIDEVFKTLIEAFVLVFIVVLVFLQDWRATLMPMIDVPGRVREQYGRLAGISSGIAGFTGLSERLGDQIIPLLSGYLDTISREVSGHGGTIDKFIGDAVMAFWGAPAANADHAVDACRAALACQRALRVEA